VKALYWLTVLTVSQPPTPDSLATGEKAAQGLLSAEKPAGVDAAAWEKTKSSLVATAHDTLGFIAMQRKQPEVAEQEYVKALEADPTQAKYSYALGNAILAQKKPERQSEVLYHWARAVSLTGPGALPEPLRTQVNTFFTKQYTAFHGADDASLKALRAQAVASPMPPAGFKIENRNEIEAKGQAEFAKEHPELALWKAIKDQLTTPNGEQYFESQLKGSAPPQLRGKLVSMKPAVNPKELVLAVSTPDTPEVTLKLETPLRGKAEPGTDIKFQGIPSAFTKEPFMVTFDVESKDKIEGWPVQAAPPARKKAAPKKQ
jgi:Tfp pilus assembly protein PilF